MMNRVECIQTFRKYGFEEQEMINTIVQILGAVPGTMIELKGLPMKAYLTPTLDIVYNGGKRHAKLEEAIKTFVNL